MKMKSEKKHTQPELPQCKENIKFEMNNAQTFVCCNRNDFALAHSHTCIAIMSMSPKAHQYSTAHTGACKQHTTKISIRYNK